MGFGGINRRVREHLIARHQAISSDPTDVSLTRSYQYWHQARAHERRENMSKQQRNTADKQVVAPLEEKELTWCVLIDPGTTLVTNNVSQFTRKV
jgi:hypothetical protein